MLELLMLVVLVVLLVIIETRCVVVALGHGSAIGHTLHDAVASSRVLVLPLPISSRSIDSYHAWAG